MTDKQPHTPFLTTLDRQMLDMLNERITRLEPLVEEWRELCRRRQQIETKYGLNRTSEKILSLLIDYPEGLEIKQIAEIMDKTTNAVRATVHDLIKKGKLTKLTPRLIGLVLNEEKGSETNGASSELS